jgi:polyadenylation factor subunit 2
MLVGLPASSLSLSQVRYWKTNLELVKSVSAHREAVRQLSFAPSDLKYATGSDDSTIRVSWLAGVD